MEDYQIIGIMFAAATVTACISDFWKAFGGPDLRPRRYVSGEPEPIADDSGFGPAGVIAPFPSSLILTGTDEEFLAALESQYDLPEVAPLKSRPFQDGEFDPDTLARVRRISREHEMKLARFRRAGLKLETNQNSKTE